MAISKDIVVDYSADPTGVANSAPSFYTGLKPDMAGEDCDLNIPFGTYKMGVRTGGFYWATGMTSLDVAGNGATLTQDTGGVVTLGSLHMTQIGIDQASGKSARVQSASAGATSVTLTEASALAGHISRATIGQWMIVAGFDIQGLFLSAYGWPPNFHFLDFVQITGIVDDTISFSGHPLQNSYSDQWPELNRGNASEGDNGGPATVYFLHADWGAPKTFSDLTLYNGDLIHCTGRDFTMYGGESTNLPIYPSVNKVWRAVDHVVSSGALVEQDKVNDTVIVEGGTYAQWHCQSSSNRLLIIEGASLSSINGTAKNTVVDNSAISGGLTIGPTAFGSGETFVCRNTSIGGAIGGGITLQTFGSGAGLQAFCTMVNGVIAIPLCTGTDILRVLAPDSHGRNVVFWMGDGRVIGSFAVLSVTSDSWPGVDDQSATTNITITNGSNALEVSDSLFQASDVGKVILVNNGRTGTPSQMRSVITGFTDAQHVTILDNFTVSRTASSQTVRWGTSNAYIQTNQSGGFPSSASLYPVLGKLGLQVPPVRTVSFENCTGSAHAIDLSQAAARNRPLWSYTKRTYDGTAFGSTGPDLLILGNVTSIKINVTKAYTGVQSTLNVGVSQFDNLTVVVGGALSTYTPRVNLKIVGERIISTGSTTGNQTGDSNLNIGSTMWLTRPMKISTNQNITGEDPSVYPEFTVEIITDQGFYTGPVAVAPLRLRLRGV